MITLYGFPSPNVLKIALMLEEAGLDYHIEHVPVLHGGGYDASFRLLNPLGKVPVIIDRTGGTEITLYESGAILIYLAETYAPELLAATGPRRWSTLQWLAVQLSYAGPMLGQMNHFQLLPSEGNSYAAERYRDQAHLVYRHYDDRLASAPWLGGDDYSIADIAMYPWTAYLTRHGFAEADFPHLVAWRARIEQRPAWQRAYARVPELAGPPRGESSAFDMDRFFGRRHAGPPVDMPAYQALGPMIRSGDSSGD